MTNNVHNTSAHRRRSRRCTRSHLCSARVVEDVVQRKAVGLRLRLWEMHSPRPGTTTRPPITSDGVKRQRYSSRYECGPGTSSGFGPLPTSRRAKKYAARRSAIKNRMLSGMKTTHMVALLGRAQVRFTGRSHASNKSATGVPPARVGRTPSKMTQTQVAFSACRSRGGTLQKCGTTITV